MYGNGIVMGLSPAEVDEMSLAQFIAAADGWNRAHEDPDAPPEAPSDEEFDRVMAVH
jgi:hypothetical protein